MPKNVATHIKNYLIPTLGVYTHSTALILEDRKGIKFGILMYINLTLAMSIFSCHLAEEKHQGTFDLLIFSCLEI